MSAAKLTLEGRRCGMSRATDNSSAVSPQQEATCLAPHCAALQHLLSLNSAAACEAVRNYLISATAKDCSIMITLAPFTVHAVDSDMHSICCEQRDPCVGAIAPGVGAEQHFRYKVAIVDLDMKPLTKIYEHFDLDQEIVENALAWSSRT
jgi:hypothetical protein